MLAAPMTTAMRIATPAHSFLHSLQERGSYTDCYSLHVPLRVSHAQYVRAFYTTPLFKAERFILRWAVNRPSTDAQAEALANGTAQTFAAWRVARRAADELLLADESGRTSSWLKVEPDGSGTRLLFGSALEPTARGPNGERRLSWAFHALLGAHDFYSRRLLEAAATRLLQA